MIFISILILIVAKALISSNNLSPVLYPRITAIIFIYAGVLTFNTLYIQSIGSGIGIYSGLFHITSISQFIEGFIYLIGSLILIAWPILVLQPKTIDSLRTSTLFVGSEDQSKKNKNNIPVSLLAFYKSNYFAEYSLVIIFSSLGASLLVSSSDLVSMYLSIELQSFGVYILATLFRDSESATSAGLKYFLLGGLSSCIILLGAGLIYSFTGLTNFESIYSLISVSEFNYVIQGLSLGLTLIFVGFLFKIAAAPLHNWSPDVYDDSPTIVTTWLTIMPKISILILLLELYTQIGSGLYTTIENLNTINSVSNLITSIIPFFNELNTTVIIKNLLLISSLLSLLIGTIVGLAQTRIKRLLAYSTISHIGFILLALSINTEQSIDSLLFYIIQYTITNLNVFLIVLALGYIIKNSIINYNNSLSPLALSLISDKGREMSQQLKDIKYISEFKGQFFSNPLLSLSLTICLFSMAGMPPLIGFFSKQFVLYSAMQSGYYFIAIVAILVSVVSASYYLKIIKVLHTDPLGSDNINEKENVIKTSFQELKSSAYLPNQKGDVNTNNLSTISASFPYPLQAKETNKEQNSFSVKNVNLLTNFHSFLISSLTLSILLFILKPSIILNITQVLSLSLFNF
uniref:NADH-ubiquinone oxidoreductase chain 2 n=1 Tax=Pleurotus citrinopileatus TaxID=98342 RepID=A0A2K9YPF1_PLECI|nr:NADH dehydrogenase subunit 2 [Pleurotus citrinopileatus]AUW35266.1 NADH dehydrogenase subunit 2 [Pleurotus citrinopileatus]